MSSIKLKAAVSGDTVEVKALITHPMETGQRKDKKTGEIIPAHYINKVNVTANGANVLDAQWSGGISKNPYLAFSYGGKAGDKVKLSWTDNKGGSDSAEIDVA